jgi:hypothetical protein
MITLSSVRRGIDEVVMLPFAKAVLQIVVEGRAQKAGSVPMGFTKLCLIKRPQMLKALFCCMRQTSQVALITLA